MRHAIASFAIVLCLLACLPAHADDYQLGIQDPQPPDTYYPLTPGQTSFVLDFGSCTGLSATADGCFVVNNETGTSITALTFTIPDTEGIPPQTASCDVTGIFAAANCPPAPNSNNDFVLTFSSGTIPASGPGTFFTITETGVPYVDFPESTVTATETGTGAAVTPEPSSVLLLATGLLAGFVYVSRLRRPA